MTLSITLLLLLVSSVLRTASSLNIVVAGGSGKLGKLVASKLSSHSVTILTRNAFLAAAPSRVTEVFGWVGEGYLEKNPHVKLRDWDGGDLLDIVGCDWVGWQEDTLKPAQVVINLVGGYTQQRNMATERIVRESLRVNPTALQIAVAPVNEDIPVLTPGMVTIKSKRLQECENMVKDNCRNAICLRLEAYKLERSCEDILNAVTSAA